MPTETNIETLPADLILKMSKTLSIKDLLHFSSISKRFRTMMMTKEAINYYCSHNKITLFIPNDTTAIWEGHHYFIEAIKVQQKIALLQKSMHEDFEQSISELGSLDNTLAHVNTEPLKEKYVLYAQLLQRAMDKKNLLAIIRSIYENMPSKDDGLSSCLQKLDKAVLAMEQLKISYGAYTDLFLIQIYCTYANFLLTKSKLECSKIDSMQQPPALIQLDNETKKKLGISMRTDSVEKIKHTYESEVEKIIEKAEIIGAAFIKANVLLDRPTLNTLLNVFGIDNAVPSIHHITEQLSNDIGAIKECLNKTDALVQMKF